MASIADNLEEVHHLIHLYETRYQRENTVTLVAVSKGQSVAAITEAREAGQMQFGENYLQEALPKIQALAKHKIVWHYIGPLQSNKTKKIAEHFDWVQSIDDFDIAKRLNDQRPEHLEPLNICLQIKISHEKAKSGMAPDHIFSVAEQCLNLPQLKLRGLMTIIEQKKDLAGQREEFKQLVYYHEKLTEKGIKTDILSMGMSDDLEAAIAEGSTMVRIGTKIFGER